MLPHLNTVLAHHKLTTLLYDRDLRPVHVEILRKRQREFDVSFCKSVVKEGSARPKVHMLMFDQGFPRQLLMYGSLWHCDAKMLEMTHKDVTRPVKEGQTDDKAIVGTILTRLEVNDSFEYRKCPFASMLHQTASEYAYDTLDEREERRQLQARLAEVHVKR